MGSKEQVEEAISNMLEDEENSDYNSVAQKLLENYDAKKIVSCVLDYASKKKETSMKDRSGRHPKSGTRDRRSNRERAISKPSDGITKGRTEFGRRSAGPPKGRYKGIKRVARKPVRPLKK